MSNTVPLAVVGLWAYWPGCADAANPVGVYHHVFLACDRTVMKSVSTGGEATITYHTDVQLTAIPKGQSHSTCDFELSPGSTEGP